jgi:hypothetical protein
MVELVIYIPLYGGIGDIHTQYNNSTIKEYVYHQFHHEGVCISPIPP